MQFVQAHSLSREQALALKRQVEASLAFKVQAIRQSSPLNAEPPDQT